MTISQERLHELRAAMEKQKILVIGDLMLDCFVYGRVERISPEAPVPVVHISKDVNMPGGSSNVASNIRALGGGASVAGMIGDDDSGLLLRKLLEDQGVSCDGVLAIPEHATTIKTRIIADHQQIVRVDREEDPEAADGYIDQFCERIVASAQHASGMIIEDYGKGAVRRQVVECILEAAKERGIPVGFDPKDDHDLNVRGITLATPNRKEAFHAAGIPESRPAENPLNDQPLLKVASILRERWNAEVLMLTLGPQGMLLVPAEGEMIHLPTRAREVFDVSGAGDTVIASCLLAWAAGATLIEAAEIANAAAGIVVGKLGTATCSIDELISVLAIK